MLIKFDGIKLIYNDGKTINDRISVKISNKTALIFVDGNIYFVFEDNKLFYKGEAQNIGDKIEELRGELEYIAFSDMQERIYNPKAIDFEGHYKITNTPEINGVYYRTDLFVDGDKRVWTKCK